MAYFSGNFFHGTAIKIQCRVFLIPWLKRNSGIICCVKGRGYSSTPLVRYIPRKGVRNEENEATSLPRRLLEQEHIGPDSSIGRIEFSNESSKKLFDADSKSDGSCLPSDVNYGLTLGMFGDSACVYSEMMLREIYLLRNNLVALEEEIEGDLTDVSDEFSEEREEVVEDISRVSSSRSRQDVQMSAIELLASRAYTSLELKKKLQGKKFLNETIDAVITDFQNRGLINDCLYAESYTRSRWSSSSWGPRRIRQALFKKGISEADAQKAIKLVFKDGESGEDEDSGTAMSKLSIDQLYVQASKQWQRSEGASHETRKSRIVRWLQYRGFNWNVIKYVLKKLESS